MRSQRPTTLTRTRSLVGLRARSEQDKDLRRGDLVRAASELFAGSDFDGVTIAQVAQRAGVAKGTAYLYFSCKEALFLELVQTELLLWEQDLHTCLAPLSTECATNALAATIARTLAKRPTLGRLLVLLHPVIEPSLALDTARSFKEFLLAFIGRISALLATKVPELGATASVTFILQVHALVISVTQLAHPPAVIAAVLDHDPRLHPMRISFEPFMAETLSTLLRGTLQTQKQT
ncbi:TetR/AcrR family transcriptional regulator [Rhodoferax aquaticus]|uniref:TetR/AcrR family transcriptional regulator n=1 Tax=Rhodoferax aquaticus TaxID=2527691 RepID=A0A515EP57_9BURK|nr:TetR family transcriptional regulator [Rhodoferax aquaticus]QDL54448.1 TetR/AcrR family transcriptional regulator [Rhodoferax aquaticus]